MSAYPNTLKELILKFSKLPGIGKKTAERLSIYILNSNKEETVDFSNALVNLKDSITTCQVCNCFIEIECHICNNENRVKDLLCIVKDPIDVFLIEKSGFKGLYHVLGGLIAPFDGITPEKLNISLLSERLKTIKEVIIAIEPSHDGDITTIYLSDIIKKKEIKVSRLARGIPVGTSLEFIDEVTLSHSINDRVEI
jgi:recombination protein RecR